MPTGKHVCVMGLLMIVITHKTEAVCHQSSYDQHYPTITLKTFYLPRYFNLYMFLHMHSSTSPKFDSGLQEYKPEFVLQKQNLTLTL